MMELVRFLQNLFKRHEEEPSTNEPVKPTMDNPNTERYRKIELPPVMVDGVIRTVKRRYVGTPNGPIEVDAFYDNELRRVAYMPKATEVSEDRTDGKP